MPKFKYGPCTFEFILAREWESLPPNKQFSDMGGIFRVQHQHLIDLWITLVAGPISSANQYPRNRINQMETILEKYGSKIEETKICNDINFCGSNNCVMINYIHNKQSKAKISICIGKLDFVFSFPFGEGAYEKMKQLIESFKIIKGEVNDIRYEDKVEFFPDNLGRQSPDFWDTVKQLFT